MSWPQRYDPLGSPLLSAAVAALPIVALLGSLAWLRLRAPVAAAIGLAAALLLAVVMVGMPPKIAIASAAFGAAYGLFPIGWIVLNVLFLYRLAADRGLFDVLRRSISSLTDDRRLQLLLIAFSFGAFVEGAAGFGTPVAVTGGLLIALGFSPLQASGLSLIANTAPVAFGALGTPIVALQAVTGLDLHELSAQVGRQLPWFSLIVPFWLVWAYAGWRGMVEVWPAVLVAGASFAIPQYLMATLHGPWLVDVVAAMSSIAALALFLKVWRPVGARQDDNRAARQAPASIRAWVPWAILSVLVFLWGLPVIKGALNAVSSPKLPVPMLDQVVQRVPPVVRVPQAEAAVFTLNWLSATGTAILVAALLTAAVLRYRPGEVLRAYGLTLKAVRASLLTIALMLSLGYLTRYSGLDAILGLAFARTGMFYPFFGTLLGWLGVALTGSDTSSNVLFGSLQRITAEQLGLNPVLMAAANSSGGVMGKMIDAQSIVVAGVVTRYEGREGEILRYVFFHSIALVTLMGLLVSAQAWLGR
ncbi:MAG: L-lactate permease [Gemmatimonadota bacterium]